MSSKVNHCTKELSASMDRNLLLRFDDDTIFFNKYRSNRQEIKIKNNAQVAKNLIEFHYTGILQVRFSEIEKFFVVASELTFHIALEALSQLLEKHSCDNSYHAVICANIACDPKNQVAAPCVLSIINHAVGFLKQAKFCNSYRLCARPYAAYRILQTLAASTNCKFSTQVALDWLLYDERRYMYADFLLEAIVYEASDELMEFVDNIVPNLPRQISQTLLQHSNRAKFQYLLSGQKVNVKSGKHLITEKKKSASDNFQNQSSLRSNSENYQTPSATFINVQNAREIKKNHNILSVDTGTQPSSTTSLTSILSAQTENLLLPASSSAQIFDERLLSKKVKTIPHLNTNISTEIPLSKSNAKPRRSYILGISSDSDENAKGISDYMDFLRNGKNSKVNEKIIEFGKKNTEGLFQLLRLERQKIENCKKSSSVCDTSDVQVLSCFDEAPIVFPSTHNRYQLPDDPKPNIDATLLNRGYFI
ncbi:unnamed protein product [Thelazia callipaeda]|uniref:BTB domain-containing protein n=1 Tax=Thelazia callipaeda TaxID=103827 RepID=A0A158RB39_THECL|nr:unnamed protein product [Thelazia callipaeda]